MFRDQKVLPEVRNQPLLPRVFFSHSTFQNALEIPPEIPLEISPEIHLGILFEISLEVHLEMHFELSPNNGIYGRGIGVCATDRSIERYTVCHCQAVLVFVRLSVSQVQNA